MRSMAYRSVSVVFVVAVVMIFMAAPHEKESDDLASLKEAFNLNRELWKSADVETHFSTVHPAGGGIDNRGRLWTMQDVDYEQVRNYVQGRKENRESQIDDLNFNIQGSTAAVTFNETATRKYAKFGGIGV